MIKNSAPALILALTLLNTISEAQKVTSVHIVDESPTDCPLRVSGQADFTESEVDGFPLVSFPFKLVVTNLSKKTVMALVVLNHFGTTDRPVLAQHNELDAYFSHEKEIAPGADFIYDHHDHNLSFPLYGQASVTKPIPSARSEVIFVQFTDKSTWGNDKDEYVVSIMKTRALLHLSLRKLAANAANGAESEFLNTLQTKSDDDHAEWVLNKIREQQKQDGTVAAVSTVRGWLAVADSR
jgi:hypothetical protein